MTHRRAHRLLYALPDGLLAPRTEFRVRQHVRGCPRCRRTLLSLEAAEALLRRLPTSLVPLDATPEAEARLAGLARWGGARTAANPARRALAPFRLPAFGAASAAVCLVALLVVGGGSRIRHDGGAEPHEAFNFVVASSLASGGATSDRHLRAARVVSTDLGAVPSLQRSDHYYLPVGVR